MIFLLNIEVSGVFFSAATDTPTFMKFLTPLLALTALASSAKAAVVYYDTRTYYSNTIDVGSSFVNIFNVAKFNIPQATLTGVTVKVVQSTMTGSITVTNTGGVAASIEAFDSAFTAKQFTTGLGYSQTTVNINDVVTSPEWHSVTLQPSVPKHSMSRRVRLSQWLTKTSLQVSGVPTLARAM